MPVGVLSGDGVDGAKARALALACANRGTPVDPEDPIRRLGASGAFGIPDRLRAAKTDLGSLADAKVKAASPQQQVTAAEQRLRTRSLASPTDSTVQALAVRAVGGEVEPGQTLMRIAPAGSSVEVEAKLSNRDVGFVRSSVAAVIEVETFPFTRYGVIKGKVIDVSDDAVSDKRPDGAEELTYMVHMRLDRDTMEVDERTVRLTSGMAATAEVKTGRRRVIEYVLSPLARAVREAGRER